MKKPLNKNVLTWCSREKRDKMQQVSKTTGIGMNTLTDMALDMLIAKASKISGTIATIQKRLIDELNK